MNPTGNLQWFHNGGASAVSGFDLDDDEWHLVGVSRDISNNYTLYMDNATESIGTSATTLSDTATVTIGGRPAGTNFFYKGFIDDVRVYNRVLTAADIQAILDQPLPPPGDPVWFVDASGSWHDSGNWTADVPNSNSTSALLSSAISAPRTIAVDTPVTIKQLDIDGAEGYVVGGTSSFTFDANAGSAAVNVTQGAISFKQP